MLRYFLTIAMVSSFSSCTCQDNNKSPNADSQLSGEADTSEASDEVKSRATAKASLSQAPTMQEKANDSTTNVDVSRKKLTFPKTSTFSLAFND